MRSPLKTTDPPQALRLVYFGPGESVHTARWLAAFVSLGHEVHFVTQDVRAGPKTSGVIIHDMSVRESGPAVVRFLLRWNRVRLILSRVRPDIVHGHMIPTGGYAAFFGHRPLVMTAWGSDVFVAPKKSRWQRAIIGWQLRRSDLVTVDSEDLKREVMRLGVPQGKIELVQWGVDVELMRSVRGDPTLRNAAEVPAGTFVVLSTRRFGPIYNLDSIIRSIPHVVSSSPRKVVFVFVGGGSGLQELQSLAAATNVTEHVRFMGDVPHAQLSRLYGGADAYISVPSSDSTSVSLLEALAAGLPVVVSDLPSNREWVRDGWNGYIVPVRDPAAIAQAVLQLVSSPSRLREFGGRNLRLAAERADHRVHMRRMEELYRSLLERSRDRPRR